MQLPASAAAQSFWVGKIEVCLLPKSPPGTEDTDWAPRADLIGHQNVYECQGHLKVTGPRQPELGQSLIQVGFLYPACTIKYFKDFIDQRDHGSQVPLFQLLRFSSDACSWQENEIHSYWGPPSTELVSTFDYFLKASISLFRNIARFPSIPQLIFWTTPWLTGLTRLLTALLC